MQIFEPFDVVAVPFPYVERVATKNRPALIISSAVLQNGEGLVWVLMITSATHAGWTNDVSVDDHLASGLPKPSVVRVAKLATCEADRCRHLGRLDATSILAVRTRLRSLIAGPARTLIQ